MKKVVFSILALLLICVLSSCDLFLQNMVTVSFETNSDTEIRQVTYFGDTLVIQPKDPIKDGFYLEGWYTDIELTDKWDFTQLVTNDMTLYAKWIAKDLLLSFDSNGGSGSMASIALPDGENTNLPANTFTREGYSFAGWATSNTGDVEYAEQASYTMDSADITLFAKWTPVDYTITYFLDGGTNNAGNPSTYNVETSNLTLKNPTKAGFVFLGWYAEDSYQTLIIQISQGNITLYAKWVEDYFTLTYHLNGGINHIENPMGYKAGTGNYTLQNPTRIGYNFEGWFLDSDYTSPVNQIPTDLRQDLNLHTKWSIVDYAVSYEMNGGTSSGSNPTTYTVADTTTLSNPTRTGYVFEGWYANSTFSGNAITQIAAGLIGDVTLYAKWSIVDYAVSYEMNGGMNSGSNPTTYTVADTTITLSNPTRTGYVFEGWYANSTFSGNAVTQIAAGSIGAVTLYAKWSIVDYAVSYEMNGGTSSGSNPTTYTVADTTMLSNPTRTGYVFDGWYANSTFSGNAITQIAAGLIGDVTLYAKWRDLTVGDIGPGGGYIFYDDEADDIDNIAGYRYLEAAPYGWQDGGADPKYVWGEYGTYIGGTSSSIGRGAVNTEKIVAKLGTNSIYAARICEEAIINGYADWFLPSNDELSEMSQQLKSKGLGSFASGYYWSSSEYYYNNAWLRYFGNGYQDYGSKSYYFYVRPVRAFN